MHHFHYLNGRLHCEDVDLARIADEVGTPVYVYSRATLVRHARVIADAFRDQKVLVAYSVKANGNLAVLSTLAAEGCGADVVSSGEMFRAIRAGIAPSRIVFSGVGKTAEEMRAALGAGICQFNVESEGELTLLSRVASGMGCSAPVALRVNPDIAAGGHPNISTGKSGDKFGVPWPDAERLYALAAGLPSIRLTGVDVHIGSQIGELAPMRAAFEKVIALAIRLRECGHPISRIDLGGGLGIAYRESDAPASPAEYAQMISEVMSGHDFELILEPGRVIAGNAGILLTTALYEKSAPDRTFLIVDAGMNDLMRPALYGAYHEIRPLKEPAAGSVEEVYDIVGPICESTDKFATARRLPRTSAGERLAVMSAGAYGAVLSSGYNARPLVPEVLVSAARYSIVRRRPDFEEMIQFEEVPDWIRMQA